MCHYVGHLGLVIVAFFWLPIVKCYGEKIFTFMDK